MRILGVDPGYDRLGVAIINKAPGTKEEFVFSDCLLSEKTDSVAVRIAGLGTELEKLIAEYRPQIIAVEKLFFTKNQKTAMAVAEMRGVIIYIGSKAGLHIEEYTPGEIKTAVTGYGKAEKADVERMVEKLIALPPKKRKDDEYDAIATALACSAIYRPSRLS